MYTCCVSLNCIVLHGLTNFHNIATPQLVTLQLNHLPSYLCQLTIHRQIKSQGEMLFSPFVCLTYSALPNTHHR